MKACAAMASRTALSGAFASALSRGVAPLATSCCRSSYSLDPAASKLWRGSGEKLARRYLAGEGRWERGAGRGRWMDGGRRCGRRGRPHARLRRALPCCLLPARCRPKLPCPLPVPPPHLSTSSELYWATVMPPLPPCVPPRAGCVTVGEAQQSRKRHKLSRRCLPSHALAIRLPHHSSAGGVPTRPALHERSALPTCAAAGTRRRTTRTPRRTCAARLIPRASTSASKGRRPAASFGRFASGQRARLWSRRSGCLKTARERERARRARRGLAAT